MNQKYDKLLGALVGLSRASEGKELERSSGDALIAGLKMSFSQDEISDAEIHDMVIRLNKEKAVMAPDCAACQSPCGRIENLDMDEIYHASEGLRDAKLELFSLLSQLAKQNPAAVQFLSGSLFLISCSYEAEQLSDSIADAKQRLQA